MGPRAQSVKACLATPQPACQYKSRATPTAHLTRQIAPTQRTHLREQFRLTLAVQPRNTLHGRAPQRCALDDVSEIACTAKRARRLATNQRRRCLRCESAYDQSQVRRVVHAHRRRSRTPGVVQSVIQQLVDVRRRHVAFRRRRAARRCRCVRVVRSRARECGEVRHHRQHSTCCHRRARYLHSQSTRASFPSPHARAPSPNLHQRR
jgi:hypothetical protein